MASSSEKRCLYEVLELSRDCTTDEIRSGYRRLALQRHPDKLVRSGVPESEATAAFQELVNAYEVLSDTQERAWYDSHRNQILFSSVSAAGGSQSFVIDLFSYFSNSVYSGFSDSGKGFYKVYPDLFEKIYANELSFARKFGLPLPKEAPLMGKLDSHYDQVIAFFDYWLGFTTVLDFFWADKNQAMGGENRKYRRVIEDENKKLRKKARREYNETVRGLAKFVKKRDKRVLEMQKKRNAEMEKKREEEKLRKKELEREKAEKARNYVEPEWARIDEVEEDDESEDSVEEKKTEFYCVVCSKKFKSDKQWRNHEQSKKHKEKVAELREAFWEEDKEFELATEGNNSEAKDEIAVGYLSADDNVNELVGQFETSVGIQEDDSDDGMIELSNADEVGDIDNKNGGAGTDDDETSILEAMLSGQKSRNKLGNRHVAPAAESESDELEFMEFNDTKGSRRNRGGRRRRGRRQEEEEEEEEEREEEETTKADVAKRNGEAEEHDEQGEDAGEPSSHPIPAESGTMASRRNKGGRRRRDRRQEEEQQGDEEETKKADVPKRNGRAEEHDEHGGDAGEPSSHPLPAKSGTKRADDATERQNKHSKHAAKKKSATKKENASKSKAEPKGRKGKMAANGSDNSCEKCGEQFESRTKLHKHLGDTGHASLKSR